MTEEIVIPIPKKLCECGCGQNTDRMFKSGHNKKPNTIEHWQWKGGRLKTPSGYIRVLAKWHPRANRDGYVYEHTLVMEQKLGRFLSPHELVHHINGDKTDNRQENLELMTKSGHCGYHMKGNKYACR